MLEAEFQKDLIKELKSLFRGAIVLKNDEQLLQGIPDLLLLYRSNWCFIEVKKDAKAKYRPNQEWYLAQAEFMGATGITIYPENKNEMISLLAKRWDVAQ